MNKIHRELHPTIENKFYTDENNCYQRYFKKCGSQRT
jgi:hypothetical protein